MLSRLRKELEILDQKRCELLNDLATLDADHLVKKPISGKWSILEIVQHMVLAEREVLEHLPDPSQLIERKRDLRARLSYLLVMLVLKWSMPVKVPSPAMVPDGNTSLDELRRQWDESQHWLRAYLNALEPDGLGRAVFRHPVAGPLTVAQVIHMRQLHFKSHLRQIERINRLLVRDS